MDVDEDASPQEKAPVPDELERWSQVARSATVPSSTSENMEKILKAVFGAESVHATPVFGYAEGEAVIEWPQIGLYGTVYDDETYFLLIDSSTNVTRSFDLALADDLSAAAKKIQKVIARRQNL